MPKPDRVWSWVNNLDSETKAVFRAYYTDNELNRTRVDALFQLIDEDEKATQEDVKRQVEALLEGYHTEDNFPELHEWLARIKADFDKIVEGALTTAIERTRALGLESFAGIPTGASTSKAQDLRQRHPFAA